TCHKSVYSGLILAGARPVWLSPDVSHELGIPLGTAAERVAAALDAEPAIRTAILTEPSYVGVLSDLPAIAEACHARGVALVCDLAGAHADGLAVDRSLRARGVQVEGADRRLLIPHITVGDDASRVDAFVPILRAAVDEHRGSVGHPPPVATSWRTNPEQAMTPREAAFAPTERVAAADAVGRVAAEFAVPYPPGIPALAPGEVSGAE